MSKWIIGSNVLCHHGVKGMRWGIRRFRDKINNHKQHKTTKHFKINNHKQHKTTKYFYKGMQAVKRASKTVISTATNPKFYVPLALGAAFVGNIVLASNGTRIKRISSKANLRL